MTTKNSVKEQLETGTSETAGKGVSEAKITTTQRATRGPVERVVRADDGHTAVDISSVQEPGVADHGNIVGGGDIPQY